METAQAKEERAAAAAAAAGSINRGIAPVPAEAEETDVTPMMVTGGSS